MTKIKIGSDFSGVGAFNQALIRLGIAYEEVFACDMDKYARQTFVLNYGEPKYYPKDVYEREIPKESLDIYMTSPPCQSFSMAGKRLGKEDQRGILFFNSLEFIRENKPRYFIFENVKGLLSHDKVDKNQEFGRTFQEWINYLGGKSINGVHTFFPYEDAVPYHIYFQVLNAKNYGIPQNRERVFIIGIRDDEDNNFQFPKPFPLEKRLKDVLENEVDEKYFLSEQNIKALLTYNERQIDNNRGFSAKFRNPDEIEIMDALKVGGGGKDDLLQVGTWRTHEDGKGFRPTEDNNCPTIPARAREDGSGQPVIKIGAIRGRNPDNPKSRQSGLETEQMLEINENGTSNALTTVQKDNVVVISEILKSIDNEKRNTAKVLLMLQQEIGKKAIETWRLRILEIIREKTLLQQRLHEESVHSKRQKGTRGTINKVQQTESIEINSYVIMRSLPKEEWERCSSQRRKSIKQLVRQLNESLQKLSYENPQTNSDLQSGELQYENKGVRILRETLSKIQEIQQPFNKQIQGQRIRRLTPIEAFRLMDFNEDFKWNVSDSQAYKQAGNSICVGVLVEIIKKLKL